MRAGLRIQLLGEFGLSCDGTPVTAMNSPRLQILLAYLILHQAAPEPRQHLAFLLWPDSTEEQARTNQRSLWHRLRCTLSNADRFLLADGLTMQWSEDAPCCLDVAEFAEHLKQAESAADTEERSRELELAVATYGGELLPGGYSNWLLAALEAWRRYSTPYPFYWQALWPLIGIALAQERPAEAITHARRLHERGQQLLPAELAALTAAALDAWDAGQVDIACDHLCRALDLAQQTNSS